MCVHVCVSAVYTLALILPLLQDVSDPDPGTLQAVEVAVRENTSMRSMEIQSSTITWTNVAVAILKGATKNSTLQTLYLQVPAEPLPPQQHIDELRSNSKLQLTVEAGESTLLVIAHSSVCDFVCVEVLYGTPHGTK